MPDIKKMRLRKKIGGVTYDIYVRTSADMVDCGGDKSTKDVIDELEERIETLETSGGGGGGGAAPVRGVDYWTEDDINAIKEYCENAILGGEW